MDKNYKGIAYKFGRKVPLETLQCIYYYTPLYKWKHSSAVNIGSWDFFLWSYNGTTKGNIGFSFTLGFNENYTDIFCSVTLQEKVMVVITKLFTI